MLDFDAIFVDYAHRKQFYAGLRTQPHTVKNHGADPATAICYTNRSEAGMWPRVIASPMASKAFLGHPKFELAKGCASAPAHAPRLIGYLCIMLEVYCDTALPGMDVMILEGPRLTVLLTDNGSGHLVGCN